MSEPRMRIALSGASGLIGSTLTPFLTGAGHTIQRLVRGTPTGANDIPWNVESGAVDGERLQGADALIHLAGRNIAVRWTQRHRREIWDSRVPATDKLCRTLAAMAYPPRTLIVASGTGFYGDRGDTILTETDGPGMGFPAEICQAWEAATASAQEAGIRVIRLRIGMVLARGGRALPKLLLPAKLGLAGPVGSGRQYVSWIALDDLIRLLFHLLTTQSTSGVFNAVAPQAVQQRDFIRALGRMLHRPAWIPMPASVVRLFFGQMGQELLLASTRVAPARATASGFAFRHPDLDDALRFELAHLNPAPDFPSPLQKGKGPG